MRKRRFLLASGLGVVLTLIGGAASAAPPSVQSGPKQEVCQAQGCPDETWHLCAEVHDFTIKGVTTTYYCYEPARPS